MSVSTYTLNEASVTTKHATKGGNMYMSFTHNCSTSPVLYLFMHAPACKTHFPKGMTQFNPNLFHENNVELMLWCVCL